MGRESLWKENGIGNARVFPFSLIVVCILFMESCVYIQLEFPIKQKRLPETKLCPWKNPDYQILILAYGKICTQDRIVSGESYNSASHSYVPYNIQVCSNYSKEGWYPLEFFYHYGPRSQIYLKSIRDRKFLETFQKHWKGSPLLSGMDWKSYKKEIREKDPILIKLYSDDAQEIEENTLWLWTLGLIPNFHSRKLKYSISPSNTLDLPDSDVSFKRTTAGSVVTKGGWIYLFWGPVASVGSQEQALATLLSEDLDRFCTSE